MSGTNNKSNLRRQPKKINYAVSPPMSLRTRYSSESSLDESFFSKTYEPLSGLPTPPTSLHSRTSSLQRSEDVVPAEEFLDPEFIGAAICLTNLIPSSTSLTMASVPLAHAILTRANLELESVALALNMLDSLDSRFAMDWRKGCPRKLQAVGLFGGSQEEEHIDSIRPEIIVLAALSLAVKFLDDFERDTSFVAENWGKKKWSNEQLNFTEFCIFKNLGFRLMPLFDMQLMIEALENINRAAEQHERELYEKISGEMESEEEGTSSNVLGVLTPLDTPLDTPIQELVGGMRGLLDMGN